MTALSGLFSAFGLSASAGLNAYIPLLVIALLARWTPWLTLSPPWDTLTHPAVIAALAVLAAVEFFADKIPAVNHFNDLLQTFIRPTAGAIAFAAGSGVLGRVHPAVALLAGLLVAGSVHTAKSAAVRPAVTAATGGLGNLPVSLAEDAVATTVSLLAVVLPLALILVACGGLWWAVRRARRAQTLVS
jgi:hypothetical protein